MTAAARALAFLIAALPVVACEDRIHILDPPGQCLAAVAPSGFALARARPTDEVVDSLCFGVRVGTYEDKLPILKQRLIESGVRVVADSYQFGPALLRELADAAGARTIEAVDRDAGDVVAFAKQQGPELAGIVLAAPPRTAGTDDASWAAETRDFLMRSSAALRAEPTTRALPIIGKVIPALSALPSVGDLSPWVDYGAVAPWTDGHPGDAALDDWLGRAARIFPDRPIVADGFGFHLSDVGAAVQSKYVARAFLEHARRGIRWSCIDYLIEPDPSNLGLLASDGTPRPAFHAVANLVTLLADPGPVFQTGSLAYRLEGADETVRQLVLQRRTGAFALVLWLEVPSSDADVALPVRLSLPAPVTRLEVRRPLDGTSAVQVAASASAIDLTVTDSPLIVDILPGC